jgi:hypothetical protein
LAGEVAALDGECGDQPGCSGQVALSGRYGLIVVVAGGGVWLG